MTVYIVTYTYYDTFEESHGQIYEVCSTREKAESVIESRQGSWGYRNWDIQEKVVDEHGDA